MDTACLDTPARSPALFLTIFPIIVKSLMELRTTVTHYLRLFAFILFILVSYAHAMELPSPPSPPWFPESPPPKEGECELA